MNYSEESKNIESESLSSVEEEEYKQEQAPEQDEYGFEMGPQLKLPPPVKIVMKPTCQESQQSAFNMTLDNEIARAALDQLSFND